MPRNTSEKRRLRSNSIWLAATSPLVFSISAYWPAMPSIIERSAPAHSASLPEVMTTPFTAASSEVCLMIASSSLIEVSSSTFIERPGVSHVTTMMPSASVSVLKFLKAMCCSLDAGCLSARRLCSILGWAKRSAPTVVKMVGTAQTRLCPPYVLDAFDDRRRAHAAADAQGHQRGRLVGAFELVEHGAEDHGAGGAERMAERDRAAVDVDLRRIDLECLHVAQHHRGKGLVEFEQVDVRLLHAGTLKQFFGDVDRAGQHHRRLRTDIGEGADFGARLHAVLGARFLAAEQHRTGAVDNAGGVAGVVHVVDTLDFGMGLDRHCVEAAHRAHRCE